MRVAEVPLLHLIGWDPYRVWALEIVFNGIFLAVLGEKPIYFCLNQKPWFPQLPLTCISCASVTSKVIQCLCSLRNDKNQVTLKADISTAMIFLLPIFHPKMCFSCSSCHKIQKCKSAHIVSMLKLLGMKLTDPYTIGSFKALPYILVFYTPGFSLESHKCVV